MSLSPVLGKSFRSRWKSRSLSSWVLGEWFRRGRTNLGSQFTSRHSTTRALIPPWHSTRPLVVVDVVIWNERSCWLCSEHHSFGKGNYMIQNMWYSCAWNGTNVYKRTRKKGNLKLWLILHRAGGWPIQNEFVSFCRSTVDMTVAEPGLSPDPRHPCLCTGPGQPATKRRPPPGHIYPLYLPTCSTAAPPTQAPARKSVLKYFIGTWLYFPF